MERRVLLCDEALAAKVAGALIAALPPGAKDSWESALHFVWQANVRLVWG